MTALIFHPARNAMQSGKGKSRHWVLVHERTSPVRIDPLMGYASSSDTDSQVRLKFDSLEAAEEYARRQGLAYQVMPEHEPTPKRTLYVDNFRADRKTPWTH
ncbi:MAG TPA: ETC complex I subunit [Devosia sp.]|nr:ETC complex I subunit [Devosia sp.]